MIPNTDNQHIIAVKSRLSVSDHERRGEFWFKTRVFCSNPCEFKPSLSLVGL